MGDSECARARVREEVWGEVGSKGRGRAGGRRDAEHPACGGQGKCAVRPGGVLDPSAWGVQGGVEGKGLGVWEGGWIDGIYVW